MRRKNGNLNYVIHKYQTMRINVGYKMFSYISLRETMLLCVYFKHDWQVDSNDMFCSHIYLEYGSLPHTFTYCVLLKKTLNLPCIHIVDSNTNSQHCHVCQSYFVFALTVSFESITMCSFCIHIGYNYMLFLDVGTLRA